MSSVRTRGTFQPGSKVEVYARTVDLFENQEGDDPVGSFEVGDAGDGDLSGLDSDGRYWLVGENAGGGKTVSVSVTAKFADSEAKGAKKASKTSGKKAPAARQQSQARKPSVVTGTRSTADVRRKKS